MPNDPIKAYMDYMAELAAIVDKHDAGALTVSECAKLMREARARYVAIVPQRKMVDVPSETV